MPLDRIIYLTYRVVFIIVVSLCSEWDISCRLVPPLNRNNELPLFPVQIGWRGREMWVVTH